MCIRDRHIRCGLKITRVVYYSSSTRVLVAALIPALRSNAVLLCVRNSYIFIYCISKSGNAIASISPLVHPSVHPFVSTPVFWTDRPLTLIFCMWVGHNHGSHEIEGQGHRSRSWVRLLQSVWPRLRTVCFLIIVNLQSYDTISTGFVVCWRCLLYTSDAADE